MAPARLLGLQSKEIVAKETDTGKNVMDRRHFLQTASLLVAGSAIGFSQTGCASESELAIPCLGPAAAPTPVPGMTYVWASEIGCALDCNLENGSNKYTGGAATDDGPRINAALAGATAADPITLIIDGSALISGLFLPAAGNWAIAGLGCGTGFFIKTGTNNDGIHNGSPTAAIPSDPGPPAPARGANVSLSNFTLNGNQGNGSNGDSTSGTRQGTAAGWYIGINLMNLNNIAIENVVVVNTPAYHFRFSNVGNVAVSGCVMQSQGLNTDGLHFDGLANDVTISNCSFSMGDDAIALNCPEGYSGNIARVTVTNCTFNSYTLMRLYTILSGKPNFSISGVSVSNCTGTFSDAAFSIGYLANGTTPNPVDLLTVSNCTLTGSAAVEVGENFGNITFSNVTWIPAKISGSMGLCSFVRPSPFYAATTFGQNLTLNNCVITRNSNINAPALILQNGSAIANLTINGLTIQDAGSYSPLPALLNIESGSIGQLILNSLTGSNITAPVSSAGFSSVGSVSGSGVLATGLEFPNAVMANEVPYISANSGLPSIKIAGSVEPYP
jgi:hypothetical protein